LCLLQLQNIPKVAGLQVFCIYSAAKHCKSYMLFASVQLQNIPKVACLQVFCIRSAAKHCKSCRLASILHLFSCKNIAKVACYLHLFSCKTFQKLHVCKYFASICSAAKHSKYFAYVQLQNIAKLADRLDNVEDKLMLDIIDHKLNIFY